MDRNFTENGIVGKDGTFYPCEFGGHGKTIELLFVSEPDQFPLVTVHQGEFSLTDVVPSREQYQTVLEWCKEFDLVFEETGSSIEWSYWWDKEHKQ